MAIVERTVSQIERLWAEVEALRAELRQIHKTDAKQERQIETLLAGLTMSPGLVAEEQPGIIVDYDDTGAPDNLDGPDYLIALATPSNEQIAEPEHLEFDGPTFSGVLSERNSDSVGVLTLEVGHGISSNRYIDVTWIDGRRRWVLTGTVSGQSVPISAGVGDNLPPVNTKIEAIKLVVVRATNRAEVPFAPYKFLWPGQPVHAWEETDRGGNRRWFFTCLPWIVVFIVGGWFSSVGARKAWASVPYWDGYRFQQLGDDRPDIMTYEGDGLIKFTVYRGELYGVGAWKHWNAAEQEWEAWIVARWDRTAKKWVNAGRSGTPPNPGLIWGNDILVWQDRLWIAGNAGGDPKVWSYDGNAQQIWIAHPLPPELSPPPFYGGSGQCLCIWGDYLYLGTDMQAFMFPVAEIGAIYRKTLTGEWNLVGGGMARWKLGDPWVRCSPIVNALLVHNDGYGEKLYALGAFAYCNGRTTPVANVAAFDGSTWHPCGDGILPRGAVSAFGRALAEFEDDDGKYLYAAGAAFANRGSARLDETIYPALLTNRGDATAGEIWLWDENHHPLMVDSRFNITWPPTGRRVGVLARALGPDRDAFVAFDGGQGDDLPPADSWHGFIVERYADDHAKLQLAIPHQFVLEERIRVQWSAGSGYPAGRRRPMIITEVTENGGRFIVVQGGWGDNLPPSPYGDTPITAIKCPPLNAQLIVISTPIARQLQRWDGAVWAGVGERLDVLRGDQELHALAVYRQKLIVGGYVHVRGDASITGTWEGWLTERVDDQCGTVMLKTPKGPKSGIKVDLSWTGSAGRTDMLATTVSATLYSCAGQVEERLNEEEAIIFFAGPPSERRHKFVTGARADLTWIAGHGGVQNRYDVLIEVQDEYRIKVMGGWGNGLRDATGWSITVSTIYATVRVVGGEGANLPTIPPPPEDEPSITFFAAAPLPYELNLFSYRNGQISHVGGGYGDEPSYQPVVIYPAVDGLSVIRHPLWAMPKLLLGTRNTPDAPTNPTNNYYSSRAALLTTRGWRPMQGGLSGRLAEVGPMVNAVLSYGTRGAAVLVGGFTSARNLVIDEADADVVPPEITCRACVRWTGRYFERIVPTPDITFGQPIKCLARYRGQIVVSGHGVPNRSCVVSVTYGTLITRISDTAGIAMLGDSRNGRLTAKTSGQTGTITLPPYHPITVTERFNLFWTADGVIKQLRDNVADIVADGRVTFSGGMGDSLPEVGTPIRAALRHGFHVGSIIDLFWTGGRGRATATAVSGGLVTFASFISDYDSKLPSVNTRLDATGRFANLPTGIHGYFWGLFSYGDWLYMLGEDRWPYSYGVSLWSGEGALQDRTPRGYPWYWTSGDAATYADLGDGPAVYVTGRSHIHSVLKHSPPSGDWSRVGVNQVVGEDISICMVDYGSPIGKRLYVASYGLEVDGALCNVAELRRSGGDWRWYPIALTHSHQWRIHWPAISGPRSPAGRRELTMAAGCPLHLDDLEHGQQVMVQNFATYHPSRGWQACPFGGLNDAGMALG